MLSGVAGLVVAALMFSTHAGTAEAVLFGLYGAGTTLRTFARSLSNVHARLAAGCGLRTLFMRCCWSRAWWGLSPSAA